MFYASFNLLRHLPRCEALCLAILLALPFELYSLARDHREDLFSKRLDGVQTLLAPGVSLSHSAACTLEKR